MLGLGRHGDHAGAAKFGKLDHRPADTARCAWNENRVPGGDGRAGQHAFCRGIRAGEGCKLGIGQRRVDGQRIRRWNGGIFGEAANMLGAVIPRAFLVQRVRRVAKPVVSDHPFADARWINAVTHSNDLAADIRSLDPREGHGSAAP